MKNLRKKLSIAILGLLIAAATGCLGEEYIRLPKHPLYSPSRLMMPNKVTGLPSEVDEVVLYIFDENDLFVNEIETSTGTTVK